MDLKTHVDTVIIIVSVLNDKINELYGKINDLKVDIANIQREMDTIRTVLSELAQQEHKTHNIDESK